MAQPVVHFEIHGKDGKQLQDFYATLFDWNVDSSNPMGYGMVQGGDGGIGGGITESDTAPMVTLYVDVPDLRAALAKAEQLGGKTVMPPQDIPGGPSIAQFRDPQGNVIGLVKGM